MQGRFDMRTFTIILAATLLGAAWAAFHFISAGGERNDSTVRPLVWAVFATPLATFIGWVIARRAELGLAAFTCFCIYFFGPFIAARIESLIDPGGLTGPGGPHGFYFIATMSGAALAGLIAAFWRARSATIQP